MKFLLKWNEISKESNNMNNTKKGKKYPRISQYLIPHVHVIQCLSIDAWGTLAVYNTTTLHESLYNCSQPPMFSASCRFCLFFYIQWFFERTIWWRNVSFGKTVSSFFPFNITVQFLLRFIHTEWKRSRTSHQHRLHISSWQSQWSACAQSEQTQMHDR